MSKYIVRVHEVYIQPVVIEAATPEEAIALVNQADGDHSIHMEFSHSLESDRWTVEECQYKSDDNEDNINVPNVSYSDILIQKRVLEKLVANKPITSVETIELQGTLNLLDYLQDQHRAEKDKESSEQAYCPCCKSVAIEGGSLNVEGKQVSQTVNCLDCNRRWTDIYSLSDVEVIPE